LDKLVPIFLSDALIGILTKDANGTLIFKYDSKYLENKDAVPLSCSLPLQKQEYYGSSAHTFFVGLLPEESELKQIAQSIGTDTSNSFRLLQEIGKECIGAVRVGGTSKQSTAKYKLITKQEWDILVQNNLQRVSYLYKEKDQRLSLAGAQSKMGALYQNGQYSFAIEGSPTNCIVKFPSDYFPNMTENEFVTMSLAKSLGIDVPNIDLVKLGGKNCFSISRFDRITQEGDILRIHQEDFCQALGILPQNKYEQDNGPSFSMCIQLIRKVCSVPVIEINKFIGIYIFNLLIGNRDAHGKNFSLIFNEGQVCLAPAYDLICTAFYNELSDNMAMKIHNQYDDEFLTLENFKTELSTSNISYKQFYEKVTNQITLLEKKLVDIYTLHTDHEFVKQYIDLIKKRLIHFKNIFH